MRDDNNTRGEPGKPGEEGESEGAGGRGGEGGAGGRGAPRGAGGRGGAGGEGALGEMGPRGERGLPGPSVSTRVLVAFVVLILVAVSVVGGLAYYVDTTRDLARETQQLAAENEERVAEALTAKAVQCAQRHDLDQQIAATAKLLKETEGEPRVFGIPRQLILDNHQRSLTTRENLAILDC